MNSTGLPVFSTVLQRSSIPAQYTVLNEESNTSCSADMYTPIDFGKEIQFDGSDDEDDANPRDAMHDHMHVPEDDDEGGQHTDSQLPH